MIKRKLATLLLGVFSITLVPMSALAGFVSYSAYQLPILQGNNYTQAHNKATNDDKIINKVTALTNTDRVTIWATDQNNTQISPDYMQQVNNTSDILFNTNKSSGDQVKMGMENYYWYWTENAWVSGEVDFR